MCEWCEVGDWIDVLKKMVETPDLEWCHDFLGSVLDFADDNQHITAKQIKGIRNCCKSNYEMSCALPARTKYEEEAYAPPAEKKPPAERKPQLKLEGQRRMIINRVPRFPREEDTDTGPLTPGD